MSKQLIALAAACGLLSLSSVAFAGKPCPWNDKQLPEKSRVCKAGTMQECVAGQWQSKGVKCTPPRFQDDRRADALGMRVQPSESRLARERLLAHIAPAS